MRFFRSVVIEANAKRKMVALELVGQWAKGARIIDAGPSRSVQHNVSGWLDKFHTFNASVYLDAELNGNLASHPHRGVDSLRNRTEPNVANRLNYLIEVWHQVNPLRVGKNFDGANIRRLVGYLRLEDFLRGEKSWYQQNCSQSVPDQRR